jgi:hypothetical protein
VAVNLDFLESGRLKQRAMGRCTRLVNRKLLCHERYLFSAGRVYSIASCERISKRAPGVCRNRFVAPQRCWQLNTSVLVPASSAVNATATENEQDDEDDKKCRRVHGTLLQSRERWRVRFIQSVGGSFRPS